MASAQSLEIEINEELLQVARTARAFLRVHHEFWETPGVNFQSYAAAVGEYLEAMDNAVEALYSVPHRND